MQLKAEFCLIFFCIALTPGGARVVPHDPNHRLMRPWIEGDQHVWMYRDDTERFTMECTAHADPPPDITWYKYETRVTPNYRRHIREDGALDVLMADMMDTGTYQCRAANQYGMARKTYHVIIMPDSIYEK